MVISPIQYDLAVLCRDRVKESFPRIDCMLWSATAPAHVPGWGAIGENDAVLEIGTTIISDLVVYFYEDYAVMYAPWTKYVRNVSYNDPKLMDILLSELETHSG